MANRNRKDDVAPVSHPSAVVPAVSLRPLPPFPAGLAYKAHPRAHDADLINRFGETVRTVRLLRAFSQIDLATRAGVHRSHISLIECGAREVRLTTICALATALHVNPGDLMPVLFLPDLPPRPTSPAFPTPPPL